MAKESADADQPSAADLLAQWRAAGRDTVAARSAAKVAEMALLAATSAEESATEVEAAASAAVEAVERARAAARRARKAAEHAAEAAQLALATAEGDKVRTGYDVDVAVEAEEAAKARFHQAEDSAHERQGDHRPRRQDSDLP